MADTKVKSDRLGNVAKRPVVTNDAPKTGVSVAGNKREIREDGTSGYSSSNPVHSEKSDSKPPKQVQRYNIVTQNMKSKNTVLKYPRAKHPNMEVSDRVKSETKAVRLSKSLAAVLRHGKMEISLDIDGYAIVQDILDHEHFKRLEVTEQDVIQACKEQEDQVKRFELLKLLPHQVTGVGSQFKIRAIGGHTIQIRNNNLREVTLDDTSNMPFIIHGTFWKAWEKIRHSGLKLLQNKTHLHFQAGMLSPPTSLPDLVRNFRNNCEVLVYVDLAKCLEYGIKFYRSTNNVIMTTGDQNKRLPSRFFLKAVHISPTTGNQIWTETLGNDDCVSQNVIVKGLEHTKQVYRKTEPKGPNPFPSNRLRNTTSLNLFNLNNSNTVDNFQLLGVKSHHDAGMIYPARARHASLNLYCKGTDNIQVLGVKTRT